MKTINIEVMLLAWAETHNGGAKVVLQLADPSDLEPFKTMTVKHGKVAGQRLAAAFVEIGDDEKPVEDKPKGGPLAQLAGRWCEDEAFQHWIAREYPAGWVLLQGAPAERAAEWVRTVCGVQSRAELDHNPNAGRTFHKVIREPYMGEGP